MNDDANKPKQSDQPSHEAAKVVIPFDIDISEIESKLEELERRISKIASFGDSQELLNKSILQERSPGNSQELLNKSILQERSPGNSQEPLNKSILQESMFEDGDLVRQPLLQSRVSYFQANLNNLDRDQDGEKNFAVMVNSINRTNDLLRQINDVVLLIYTNMQNNRNA